ncbi:TXND-like protein [Mya arenaria]|uniref:TXND-like protein n=1 Tax=Mya arenaria TaxID=6604 RepID=A0ABY7F3P3_MYAAR|nr:TXND-like protein [Mya arenaria]
MTAVHLKQILSSCFLCFYLIGSVQSVVQQLGSGEFNEFLRNNQLTLVLFKIVKRFMTDDTLAAQLGASDYPSLVYFRGAYPALYHGGLQSEEDIPDLVEWLQSAATIATQDLHESSFEHLTQASSGATTGDWFVLFFQPDSEESMRILPSWECAAIRQKHRMNFAKVDIDLNKKLGARFQITKCPTGILFRQGKMYMYEPEKWDSDSIVAFVEGWYKNVKAKPVLIEPTTFDVLTESIAMFIKDKVEGENTSWMFVAMAIGACCLVVAMVICVFRKPAQTRSKFE